VAIFDSTWPIVGQEQVAATFDVSVPQPSGGVYPKGTLSASFVFPSDLTDVLNTISVGSFTATFQLRLSIDSPDGSPSITVLVPLPDTQVPSAGPFRVNTTATMPTLAFTHPGIVVVAIDGGSFAVTALQTDGSPVTGIDLSHIPCTPGPGSDTTLVAFTATGSATH
jgi:hypothetical protein